MKDLVDTHVDVLVDASEILRFALDDNKILCGESYQQQACTPRAVARAVSTAMAIFSNLFHILFQFNYTPPSGSPSSSVSFGYLMPTLL